MYYVVIKQKPLVHEMTFEEFLFSQNPSSYIINSNESNTRTFVTDNAYDVPNSASGLFKSKEYLISKLVEFNSLAQVRSIVDSDRRNYYQTFYIPKSSGGLRKIDAPTAELMSSLNLLKSIFENDFNALYHTSAFAYVKNRSTIDALKKHQNNESKWFSKFDLHNFFGSTTKEFVIKMLSMIYPFSMVIEDENGKKQLSDAIDLAFLDGVLPQGTPISPMLTNLMMIPIDFELSNKLRNYNKQSYVYTRYADDFIVSSKYNFMFKNIQNEIIDTLKKFDAPFSLNTKKTRYGSSSGSNWNLGLMLNKDNEITIGHKKKKQFESMLASYSIDKNNGVQWSVEDLQTLMGLYSYYKKVEGETIDRIVAFMSNKFGIDILKSIKLDIYPKEGRADAQ